MQRADSGAHGLRWGLVIGLAYCVLLYLRFGLGADNAGIFGLLTFIGFVAAVALLLFCGFGFRKANGGFAEMKELFKAMFIAVLVFELVYSVFTLVYLKYIDPGFFDKFRLSTEEILLKLKGPQDQNDKILKGIDVWAQQARGLNVFDFLKTYLYNVAITGLFALLFAFALKRKPPASGPGTFKLG